MGKDVIVEIAGVIIMIAACYAIMLIGVGFNLN